MHEDITERKRAEEVHARLAAIVESSEDAIIGKTLEGTITNWNRGAQNIYGYSAEEVVGKPINILVPPDRPNEIPKILERLRRGEAIDHYETVRVAKDGRRLDISLTISPIRDSSGNIAGASTIARNITERKRAEEELNNMTLYDIVAADRKSIDSNIRHILEQKRRCVGERKFRRKDGSLVDVEVSVSTILRNGRETLCDVAH